MNEAACCENRAPDALLHSSSHEVDSHGGSVLFVVALENGHRY